MNIQEQGFPLDLGASFTEDAPRPPVPGEEGELVSTDPRPISHSFCSGKGAGIKGETSTATCSQHGSRAGVWASEEAREMSQGLI